MYKINSSNKFATFLLTNFTNSILYRILNLMSKTVGFKT